MNEGKAQGHSLYRGFCGEDKESRVNTLGLASLNNSSGLRIIGASKGRL